jgi:nucleoside-diphosphate-sugar epimerase
MVRGTTALRAALITGATGFVGSHLAEALLARGWRVRAIVRRTSSLRWLDGLPIERVEADLRCDGIPSDAWKGVEAAFHVAGRLAGTEEELMESNARATERLADQAAAHGRHLRRFVYVSSVAACGPSEPGRPLDEDAPCRPVSAYGRSKRAGERAVFAFADRMPVTVVRPPVVCGARDRGLLPMFRAAASGIMLDPAPLEELSIVYVEDLVEGICAAAAKEDAAGRVYFLAHPDPVPARRLAEWAARPAGARRVRWLRVPRAWMWGAAVAVEWAGRTGIPVPLFNRDKVREMSQRAWTCSPARAERELGWRARTGPRAAVEQTARWYVREEWIARRRA